MRESDDDDFDDETIALLRRSFEDVKAGRVYSIEEVARQFGVTLHREPDFDDETAAALIAACERAQRGEPGLSVAEARAKLTW